MLNSVLIKPSTDMKKKEDKKPPDSQQKVDNGKNDLPGYPIYPANEDIFNKYQEEKEINPEDISKPKAVLTDDESNAETDLNSKLRGSDLDVPGSELDDEMEAIGSEDEENNYYSIGGDEHNNLEENQG